MRIKKLYLGVDVGGTNVRFGIVSTNGQVLKKKKISTNTRAPAKIFINELTKELCELVDSAGSSWESIYGVGVGFPGLVDEIKGIVLDHPYIPSWKNIALTGELEKRLNVPVFLDHDLRVITLGEMSHGIARGKKNFVVGTIGTGLGLCIVIDGRIYRRSTGEWGHITLNVNGPRCGCGNRGCLECFTAGPAIVRRARRKVKKDPRSLILKLAGGKLNQITAEMVFRAAKEGDPSACKIVNEVGMLLGAGVLNVIKILNPEIFIIGGGISEAGDIIFEPIRRFVQERAWMFKDACKKIVPSSLGEDAGIIGAAEMVRQRLDEKKA